MKRGRTLRGQLTISFAVALFIGLFGFAIAAQFAIGQVRRGTVDLRISTATRALIPISVNRGGELGLATSEERTVDRIVAPLLNGAIVQRGGRVVASTAVTVPTSILGFADRPPPATTLYTIATGGPYHEQLRVAVTPVPTRAHPLGVAMVWRSEPSWMDIDSRLAIIFACAVPLVVIFAVVAGAVAAARGLAPLGSVARIASEIEASDLSRRIGNIGSHDELGTLAETFDRMLDRLQKAFERERRFTSDASHELRAPLSVIRAEADLMLRRARPAQEYERALAEITVQAERLEQLTRDLLAAARAGASHGRRSSESFDVLPIVRAGVQELRPLAQERGVHVDVSGAEPLLVVGRSSDFQRAIVCTLHNALKFAREHGAVRVHCTATGSLVTIDVEDDGPGFSEQALRHALERFWRDERVRGDAAMRPSAGSGLGLAIAHEILVGYGGSVRVANRDAGGGHVRLTFPAAERAASPAHDAPVMPVLS